MTTLAAWVSWDSRAPAAVYIATDSQISFYDKSKDAITKTQIGTKTFNQPDLPDIFGFSGYYPLDIENRFKLIFSLIPQHRNASSEITEYISQISKLIDDKFNDSSDFVILHGFVFNNQVALVSYSRDEKKGFSFNFLSNKQGIIAKRGSGGKCTFEFEKNTLGLKEYKLSRCMWRITHDSIDSGIDRFTSGPPQLVAVYKNGRPHRLGVTWRGQTYYGNELLSKTTYKGECRNENFERVDSSGLTIKGAQRHAVIAIPRTSTTTGVDGLVDLH